MRQPLSTSGAEYRSDDKLGPTVGYASDCSSPSTHFAVLEPPPSSGERTRRIAAESAWEQRPEVWGWDECFHVSDGSAAGDCLGDEGITPIRADRSPKRTIALYGCER